MSSFCLESHPGDVISTTRPDEKKKDKKIANDIPKSIKLRQHTSMVPIILETDPGQFAGVLSAAIGQVVALHYKTGHCVAGVVESVENLLNLVTLAYVLTEHDFNDDISYVCSAEESYNFSRVWVVETRNEVTKTQHLAQYEMHLQTPCFVEQDPQRFQNMSEAQRESFREFQLLSPGCRLHGSVVYGLSSASSDVDVCVDGADLEALLDILPQSPFQLESNLLHLRIPRLILTHRRSGTMMDLVGMQHYEPVKDRVMIRICQDPTFRSFLQLVRRWWKDYELAPAEGYPNSFNMLLMGVFFLQLFEDVPIWQELAAPKGAPCPSCRPDHSATDIFGSFLYFLTRPELSCSVHMDLCVGQWQDKSERDHSLTWVLLDPCHRRNVFAGFYPEPLRHVIGHLVGPDLELFREDFPDFQLVFVC